MLLSLGVDYDICHEEEFIKKIKDIAKKNCKLSIQIESMKKIYMGNSY